MQQIFSILFKVFFVMLIIGVLMITTFALAKEKPTIPPQFRGKPTQVIFFAHNSVGSNIIEAMPHVIGNKAFPNIFDIDDGVTSLTITKEQPALYGFRLGGNGDVEIKLQNFTNLLDKYSDTVDTAIFKLCYVDMKLDTDVQALFSLYKKYMDKIKVRHPHIKIVHMTMPLTARGWKQKAKGVISSSDMLYLKRHNFNKLIRDTYGSDVFDIASIESNYGKESFSYDGNDVPVLWSAFTDDGGHLNRVGGMTVAKELLIFLQAHKKMT